MILKKTYKNYIPKNITLFFIAIISQCFGQNTKSIRFQNYSINEGLSQSTVYDIIQDNKGFIWLATQDGLNKYDGLTFKTYYHNKKDTNSLYSSTVNCLKNDSLNNILWIGTEKGLNVFDFKTNKIKRFNFPNKINNSISKILIDEYQTIWVNTENNGLFYISDSVIHKTSIPNNENSKIFLINNQLIYSSKNQSFNINISSKVSKKEYSWNDLYFVQKENNKTAYVNNLGLFLISNKIKINLSRKFPELRNVKFQSLLLNNNLLWIGTETKGLYLIDFKENTINNFYDEENNKYSIIGNHIQTIFQDYAGIIWLGTSNSGFSMFDYSKQKVTHYTYKKKQGLSSKVVWSINEDKNKNLYVGTLNGLDKINRKNGRITHYIIDNKQKANVRAIYIGKEFLLSAHNYLYKFINNKNGSVFINLFDQLPEKITNDLVIYTIEHYNNKKYWIGTNKGLFLFNSIDKSYIIFNKKNSNILNESIRVVYKSNDNKYWLGTEKGLHKMTIYNDTAVNFEYLLPDENKNSIEGLIITSIQEDLDNNLWIGTYDGALNEIDLKSNKTYHYSIKEGLANNAVYGILKSDSNLWISTNKGISSYNVFENQFKNYFESDGLQSNEFNTGAYYKSLSGELFFGGINGLSCFYPKHFSDNSISPKLSITKILINNEPLNKLKKYKDSAASELNEITLNYKQNNVSISFAALHYSNSSKNKFKYFIREINDTSTTITNQKEANYTSLNPGEYNLVVYGANGDNIWAKDPINFKIIINPPFWGTWWFQISLFSLIAFIIYGSIKRRIKTVKKQKQKLAQLVKKRTETIFKQKEQIEKQKELIEIEKVKSDNVLNKIFPDKIAEELKNKKKVKAKNYKEVSILFADFVQFSKTSSSLSPQKLIEQLNKYFIQFDKIIVQNKLVQIKTIGDSYMAVGGLPKVNKTNAVDAVLSAIQIQSYIENLKKTKDNVWEVRIGINTGEVVAGVLQTKRPLYDIWGSSVNIASRLQDGGKPGKVNISKSTYEKIKPYFICSERGGILAKNVGLIDMYFVERIKPSLSQNKHGTIVNKNFWKYVDTYRKSKIKYNRLESDFIEFLRKNLPDNLYYHSIEHTKDVIEAVERIGMNEGIFDERLLLLKTAALIHDSGFIKQYSNNEEVGAEYAKEFLPKYGFNSQQIKTVCSLILATKVNVEPVNKMQQIIKDADLDYLGRDDFEEISNNLFKELLEKGFIKNKSEWDKIQIKFFKEHKYYTDYSKKKRTFGKNQKAKLIIDSNL